MRAKEPFAAVRKNSPYTGYFVDASGAPLLATNGHILVSTAPAILDLEIELEKARGVGIVPDIRRLFDTIKSVRKLSGKMKRGRYNPVPDVACAKAAQERLESDLVRAERAQSVAAKQFDAAYATHAATTNRKAKAVARKTRDDMHKVMLDAAKKVSELRKKLVEQDDPCFHALVFDKAHYDLRLIARVLRALGAKDAHIDVTGAWDDPAILTTEKGIAIVMPFRN